MPLREMTDRAGVIWKVWDITPDQLHPSTRSGEYLQGFLDGWLVFETLDGAEKRRLHPVPVGWESLSDEELDRLCASAQAVRGGAGRPAGSRGEMRPSTTTGPAGADGEGARAETGASGEAPPRRTAERPGTRTFLFPGGRVWTVAEQYIQLRDRMGRPLDTRTVLRFTSGMRSLDLLAWPPDWAAYSDEALADLLVRAFPRPRESAPSGQFQRRRTDARA